MSGTNSSNDILGFIPKNKYVLYTYLAVLISSGVGLLSALMSIVTIYSPLGGLVGLIGLIGLVMAVLGLFMFKEEFPPLDQAHLAYLCVLFGLFFIIGSTIVYSFMFSPVLSSLVSIIISGAEFLLIFTGFNSWKHGRTITKDNIKSEVQLAMKRS